MSKLIIVTWVITIGLLSSFSDALAQRRVFQTDTFLYGASVYPELQTWEESLRMLDDFEKAHITVLRVGESAWGNLEPQPGQYEFAWLRRFLDEMHRRGLKAILGTNSYIAPQWLLVQHPEARMELLPGQPVNPLVRKAASIHHPAYRKAVRAFLTAFAGAFKDHPAVIGWQLDNEIDALATRVDYNPATQQAFTAWLRKTYQTPEALNRRWGLKAWGLTINDLGDVKLPSTGVEGEAPALSFAYQRFVRDEIAVFLKEMADIIHQAGATQWCLSNFMAYPSLGYDAAFSPTLDVNGLNIYPASNSNAAAWASLAQHFDLSRSARNQNQFIVTECRYGVMGDARIWDPVASPNQFKMMNLAPAAFGSIGSIYWTGNRYVGGHWPHWGGLLDWTGKPEPDFSLAVEIGDFFRKWGKQLITNGVMAKAAILTDYDQVMAHRSYPHTSKNAGEYTTTAFFDAFHRLGVGVDGLTVQQAAESSRLNLYEVIVVSAASVFNRDTVVKNLQSFVERGGTLIVSPLTGYQTADGVFHNNGFASILQPLTGTFVQTVRLIKPQGDDERTPQAVRFGAATFAIGGEGFCEFLHVDAGATVMPTARFTVEDPFLNNKPAITRRTLGKGRVYKLAFWPVGDKLAEFMIQLHQPKNPLFRQILPAGVQAVPRKDNSIFLINTGSESVNVTLTKNRKDRISGRLIPAKLSLAPYEVVWLE